jgi:pre-mRNA-splicing factor CWC22
MERRGDASRKRPRTGGEEQIARPSSKRRGGIYVPPYRAIAEDDAGEFGSAEYQRCSWNALRKSITSLVNKATAANVRHVAPSRIFIKMLFQDLAEHLGIRTLSNKMNDDEDTAVRDALFPRDCAKNTRFAINFFTAIGLGGSGGSRTKF